MRKLNKKKKTFDIKEKLDLYKKKIENNSKKKKKTNIKEKNEESKVKVENTKKRNNKKRNNNRGRNNSKNNINNKKRKRSFWKKLLTCILILGIIAVLSVAAFFTYIVITAPEFKESAFNVQDQTVVYDINGEVIATLGTEKRESVSYNELPQVLIDAIIATEDSRFFQHNGVDLLRFIKATVLQLAGNSSAGGASTITMQAVKNNLTKKDNVEKSSIKKIIRKFQDVYLAVFEVEKEYTKKEILEFYVNDNYLGGPAYGVEEASKYYFGKSVSELTLPEAALIAGLFQLPGSNNPYRNIEGATARRSLVLEYMYSHGYITKEEKDLANSISVESLLVGIKDESSYQGFIDTVVDEVVKLTGNNPYSVSMKIYTTMEKNIQDGINGILENKAWYWKDDNVQAGIAIVNVETGAIAAIGAGRNRTGERTFNYATGALKQPGSTAKPIFAYGPGFEYNNYSTYTLYVDEPWTYTNGPSINNWDGGFHGIVTTRYALQYSRNIPAVKAYQNIGSKKIQQFASSLGLNVSLNQSSDNYKVLNDNGLDNTINEAYAIGGVAEGFTPLEMAAAYSGFASGGYYTKPYSVTKIELRETGETIEYKPTKERVMKDSTAYLMNNILESAVEVGFNGGAKVPGSHVAAKTGTTNYPDNIISSYKLPANAVNDLWTVAYTSQYSIAVWYGYENINYGYNTSNGGQKEGLVSAVMKYIPKDTKGFKMPSSVVAVQVEKETWPAKLPSKYTPSDMITTEYFIRGTQPTEESERYTQLDNITNTNIEISGNTATITWNYTTPKVLTTEYINNYFNQSIFGNSKEKLANERIKYNNDTLGTIGFGIYKELEDGTLTLLAYTNDTKYTYEGDTSGDVTLIIKAEHKNYKSNASSGTKIDFTLKGGIAQTLIATLNGNSSISVNVGSYKELGIKNIYYGTFNVTSSAKVMYQLINETDIKEYNTLNELETAINNLPAGTYKINYVITYKGKELIKNRTINLK